MDVRVEHGELELRILDIGVRLPCILLRVESRNSCRIDYRIVGGVLFFRYRRIRNMMVSTKDSWNVQAATPRANSVFPDFTPL